MSILYVNGVQVEGVVDVRSAVYTHFFKHFKALDVVRPRAMDLNFRTLQYRDGAALVRPFTTEELKTAVWGCDNYKCPDLDGVNFGFIEDFWEEMNLELFRFVSDFHRNGKLLKGIKSTFITLIPK